MKPPVSLCHVNLARAPRLRGGERQTLILIQALAAEGVLRQRLVVLRRGSFSGCLQEIPGLEVCRVSSRLSAAFACRGAELVHAHEAHAVQAACAAGLCGTRYLITRRLIKPVGVSPYTVIAYRQAQLVVALTGAIEDVVQCRFPGLQTSRIPSAWRPEPVDPEVRRAVRARFAGKFIVGHVAAMDGQEKGHAVLLQAARMLQPDFPDIQFLLLGSGRLEKKLQEQAAGLQNVYFAGWIERSVSWISAMDLFVFPSLCEPLGSTLLDALHAGVPVMASRSGGVPEIVGDCGVLLPPGDADALAQQVVRLYHSDSLRQGLSECGIALAENYSPRRMAQRYLEVYRTLGAAVA